MCFHFPVGLSSISLVLSANTTLSQILSWLCLKPIPSSLSQWTSCSHSPLSYHKPFYSSFPLTNLHHFVFPSVSFLFALLRCRLRVLPLSHSQLFLEVQQLRHFCCDHGLLCFLGFECSNLVPLWWMEWQGLIDFSNLNLIWLNTLSYMDEQIGSFLVKQETIN